MNEKCYLVSCCSIHLQWVVFSSVTIFQFLNLHVKVELNQGCGVVVVLFRLRLRLWAFYHDSGRLRLQVLPKYRGVLNFTNFSGKPHHNLYFCDVSSQEMTLSYGLCNDTKKLNRENDGEIIMFLTTWILTWDINPACFENLLSFVLRSEKTTFDIHILLE